MHCVRQAAVDEVLLPCASREGCRLLAVLVAPERVQHVGRVVPPIEEQMTTCVSGPHAFAASICVFCPSQSTSSGEPLGKEKMGAPVSESVSPVGAGLTGANDKGCSLQWPKRKPSVGHIGDDHTLWRNARLQQGRARLLCAYYSERSELLRSG